MKKQENMEKNEIPDEDESVKKYVTGFKWACGIIILAYVGVLIWFFIEMKKLKECESNESPYCPTYKCSGNDTLCGNRAFRCSEFDLGNGGCSNQFKVCQ